MLHRWLWKIGSYLEPRLEYVSTGFLSRLVTQVEQRRVARELVKQHGIQVVHQPTPVSAREPSLMTDLNVPVVIGRAEAAMDAFSGASWAASLLSTLSSCPRGRALGCRREAFPCSAASA